MEVEPREEAASEEAGTQPKGGDRKTWYPYITKTQFEKFLSRLQSKVPEEINRDYVRAIIRTPSMIYRFLRGIEAMKLIDREQRPTARLHTLVALETRRQALDEIVKDLYPGLLQEWEGSGGKMSDRDIVSFFRKETGMGNDSANKMKMFFKYLLGEAEMSEDESEDGMSDEVDSAEPVDTVEEAEPAEPVEALRSQPAPQVQRQPQGQGRGRPEGGRPEGGPPERRDSQQERRDGRGDRGDNQQERREGRGDGPRDRGDSSRDRGDSSRDRGDSSRDRGDSSRDRGDSSRDRGDSSRDRGDNARDRGGPQVSRDSAPLDRGDSQLDRPSRVLSEAQRAYLDTLKSVLKVNIDGDWDDDMIRLAFDRLERLFDRVRRG
ncbi:MAG: DUF5343 domain-containing protein [Gemmatimonadota bacterium]